jgi:ATP-dependent DNA ligase
VDGEIVIRSGCTFSFDDLLPRIHPAENRVDKLSSTDPAQVIVSDLLVTTDGRSLVELTFDERPARLEDFFVKNLAVDPILRLSPSSERLSPINRPTATAW